MPTIVEKGRTDSIREISVFDWVWAFLSAFVNRSFMSYSKKVIGDNIAVPETK